MNTRSPQHFRFGSLRTKTIETPGGRCSKEPRHEYEGGGAYLKSRHLSTIIQSPILLPLRKHVLQPDPAILWHVLETSFQGSTLENVGATWWIGVSSF